MVHAFVMVTTGAGESREAIERIRDLDGVTEAHVIAGDHDIIAEVDAPEVYDVLRTASDSIQAIDGVAATTTYIALD